MIQESTIKVHDHLWVSFEKVTPGGCNLKIETQRETRVRVFYLSTFRETPDFMLDWITLRAGTWFIPEFKVKSGITFIRIEEDLEGTKEIYHLTVPYKEPVSSDVKIICLGLNKTGTTSLARAMANLGFSCAPELHGHFFLLSKTIAGFYGEMEDYLQSPIYDFYEDIPYSMPGVGPEIIRRMPNSRYILTTRDPQKWARSARRHWQMGDDNFKTFGLTREVVSIMEESFHGTGRIKMRSLDNLLGVVFRRFLDPNLYDNAQDYLVALYEKHLRLNRQALQKSGCDWIEIDVSKPGELKRLCEWLEIKPIAWDFPHENKGNYNAS